MLYIYYKLKYTFIFFKIGGQAHVCPTPLYSLLAHMSVQAFNLLITLLDSIWVNNLISHYVKKGFSFLIWWMSVLYTRIWIYGAKYKDIKMKNRQRRFLLFLTCYMETHEKPLVAVFVFWKIAIDSFYFI